MTAEVFSLSCSGFSAYAEAFARDREPDGSGYRLWLVSLVGGTTAVRAIWANLLQGELATIRRDDEPLGWNHQLPRDGIRWHAYQAALPAEGATHLLLLPDRASCTADHADFLLVPREQDDVAMLHYRSIQRRLRLPLQPAWGDWLWQRARDYGEAVELEGFGCHAYRCQPNESLLAEDLSAAVAAGSLTIPGEEALACAA